jgi:hypothetical protein
MYGMYGIGSKVGIVEYIIHRSNRLMLQSTSGRPTEVLIIKSHMTRDRS